MLSAEVFQAGIQKTRVRQSRMQVQLWRWQNCRATATKDSVTMADESIRGHLKSARIIEILAGFCVSNSVLLE